MTTDPFLEAVRAVPHGEKCVTNDYPGDYFGPCDCDRDERIAKGLRAACRATADVRPAGFTYIEYDEAALVAFREASLGGPTA